MNDSFIIIIGSTLRTFLANPFRILILSFVGHDAIGPVTAARCKISGVTSAYLPPPQTSLCPPPDRGGQPDFSLAV